MAIATVKQLCTPKTVVTSDSLVEQVAQLDEFAWTKLKAESFFGEITSRLAWRVETLVPLKSSSQIGQITVSTNSCHGHGPSQSNRTPPDPARLQTTLTIFRSEAAVEGRKVLSSRNAPNQTFNSSMRRRRFSRTSLGATGEQQGKSCDGQHYADDREGVAKPHDQRLALDDAAQGHNGLVGGGGRNRRAFLSISGSGAEPRGLLPLTN